MSDWKERLKVERDELKDRYLRLSSVISSGNHVAFGPAQQYLLEQQAKAMLGYLNILEARLDFAERAK